MSAISIFAKGLLASSLATTNRRLAAAALVTAVAGLGVVTLHPGHDESSAMLVRSPELTSSGATQAKAEPVEIERLLSILAQKNSTPHDGPVEIHHLDEASINLAAYRITAEAAYEAFAASKRNALDHPDSNHARDSAAQMHAALTLDVHNLNLALGSFSALVKRAEASLGKSATAQYKALLVSSSAPIEMRASEILRNATLHQQAIHRATAIPEDATILAPGQNSTTPSLIAQSMSMRD